MKRMTAKNHMPLIFLLLGAACALVGLAEVSRLVVLHCASTGWEAKFCLELAAYAVGAVWVVHRFCRGSKAAFEPVNSNLVGKPPKKGRLLIKENPEKPSHL